MEAGGESWLERSVSTPNKAKKATLAGGRRATEGMCACDTDRVPFAICQESFLEKQGVPRLL